MMNEILYYTDRKPSVNDVIDLYKSAGLPRPIDDVERMQLMIDNSNLLVSAWHGDVLVGFSRSITDWVWSCYLADLAVREGYKSTGIGKELVRRTQEILGARSMILLLSVPDAMEYYPKIGFAKHNSSFIINRSE